MIAGAKESARRRREPRHRSVVNGISRLVIASSNAGKLREFQRLLSPLGIDVVAQADLNIPDAEEPHATFVENALAKARHASQLAQLPALADDSGVCVNALAGAPGVHSARYAGEPRSDARNNAKLIAALAGAADRRAHYYCMLALTRHADDPEPILAEGRWYGEIVDDAERNGRLRLRSALRGPANRAHRRRTAAGTQESDLAPRPGDAGADRAAAGRAMSAGNDPGLRSPHFDALPPLSLYVHIPWCIKKCPYCDFNSHERRDEMPEAQYVDALIADLEFALPSIWGRRVETVFFGGGTPSLFSARRDRPHPRCRSCTRAACAGRRNHAGSQSGNVRAAKVLGLQGGRHQSAFVGRAKLRCAVSQGPGTGARRARGTRRGACGDRHFRQCQPRLDVRLARPDARRRGRRRCRGARIRSAASIVLPSDHRAEHAVSPPAAVTARRRCRGGYRGRGRRRACAGRIRALRNVGACEAQAASAATT